MKRVGVSVKGKEANLDKIKSIVHMNPLQSRKEILVGTRAAKGL
jgi:hypothetical protein